jgi:5-methyltetrahydrofolate--homocysteine methyltransferase
MEFLKALETQVLVIDGATGTMVQGLDLSDQDFGGAEFKMLADLLVHSRPEDQIGIHLAYLRAGASAVETNTFGASPLRLEEYDFSRLDTSSFPEDPDGLDLTRLSHQEMAYHTSRQAARLGQEALSRYRKEPEYDGRPLFVLGSIGPSNHVLSCTRADLKKGTFPQIVDNFYHQVWGLVDGGADVCLIETSQDILEVKAAVFGCHKAFEATGKQLPIVAQMTVDEHARMQIFNTDIQAALTTVQGIGVDVFGINCSIGPDLMERAVAKIVRHSRLPVSVIPNAGLPESIAGETVFKLQPEPFAELVTNLVDRYNIHMVGGCCGTRPEHIRLLAEAMKGRRPEAPAPAPGLFLSGPQNAVLLDSSRSLIKIGERLNVRGSKKVRTAVESGGETDFDALQEVVSHQVRDLGLRILDVCMDSNLVDTSKTLSQVIYETTDDFPGAMCLDSFEVEALQAACESYPGRPLVNSFSLEDYRPGEDKIDAVCEATRAHDPCYIALCTGPDGPGATREEKLDLATRIIEKAHSKWKVAHENIFVDVNVFPVGSESDPEVNFQLETLEAIRLVKQRFPAVHTTLGVGNLTMGLAKKPYMRKVLLSVFMEEARQRGLDAAIINPDHYVFPEDLDPADYQLGRRVILERDMEAYTALEDLALRKKGEKVERRTSYDDLKLEEQICERIKDGFKERRPGTLEFQGQEYPYLDTIVPLVAKALKNHPPLVFINDFLMKAMQELGDAFGRGDASLPHLLKSADIMKQAMGFLENFMRRSSGEDVHEGISYKGTVVLGTVFQDVHSIGKDLAKTLLENYGYRVVDLGVQTNLQDFLDAAKQSGATAIGASALLVQTSNHMITLSQMMLDQGLGDIPLLIGGAPVSPRHAGYVAMGEAQDPDTMRDNVFYCASAMDGVNVMSRLLSEDAPHVLRENRTLLKRQFQRAESRRAHTEELLETLPRRKVPLEDAPVSADTFQAPCPFTLKLSEVTEFLDCKALFGLNWRFGGERGREKKGHSQEQLDQLLQEWLTRSQTHGWIQPQGMTAIYPCQAHGDQVVIFDPESPERELGRFDFTVVVGEEEKDKFSPAQFFHPLGSEVKDPLGVQITTVGPAIVDAVEVLKARGDSEGAHLLQGLGDRIAEDLADFAHARLREKVGVASNTGTRYSPGYPSMREMRNNRLIMDLFQTPKTLGVTLTEADQFQPTSTTAAVACFHPAASYK